MMELDQLNLRKNQDFFPRISCKFNAEGNTKLQKVFRSQSSVLGTVFLLQHGLFLEVDQEPIFLYCEENCRYTLVKKLEQQSFVLAKVKKKANDTYICDFFCFQQQIPVDLWKVYVSPLMIKKIAEKFDRSADFFAQQLQFSAFDKEFLCSMGQNRQGFAFSLGHYPSEEEEKQGMERSMSPSFQIYAEKFSLLLALESDCFRVTRIIPYGKKKKEISRPLSFARGKIQFQTEKSVPPMSALQLVENQKGAEYIALWDAYATQEGDLLLMEMRRVGEIFFQEPVKKIIPTLSSPYFKKAQGRYVYQCVFQDPKQGNLFQNTEGMLLLSPYHPKHLEESMTWQAYISLRKTREMKKKEQRCLYFLESDKKSLIFFPEKPGRLLLLPKETEIPAEEVEKFDQVMVQERKEKIHISLDLGGDEQRIKRRNQARNRMQDGESANPRMAKVLEGQSNSAVEQREFLSSWDLQEVVESAFSQNATESQKEAVRIALNTPDIAVIQGPPGTGKTTVITAIMEGLNRELTRARRKPGEILVTSYQHDAVKNVLDRVQINSLPGVKYLGTQQETEENNAMETWVKDWAEKFQKKHPSLGETEKQEQLERIYGQYFRYPSSENELSFLNLAEELVKSPSTSTMLQQIKDDITEENEKNTGEILPLIRKLRCTQRGFSDDGVKQGKSLAVAICMESGGKEDSVTKLKVQFPALFQFLSGVEVPVDQTFLEKLATEKEILLQHYTPRQKYQIQQPKKKILQLFRRLQEELKDYDQETGHMVEDGILADLLKAAKQPSQVKEAISKYSLVYAATMQHSVAFPMSKAKKQAENAIIFDTVIVDEAARANPMDLMISLTQAQDRIILVGDHRQLPHIYEEEILEKLQEENGFSLPSDTMKQSMFEYLMEIGKKLEILDGIPRTITLGEQFRMHPVIGEFVSQHFYGKYDNSALKIKESFTSPRPSSDFWQPYHHFPLLWLNVPVDPARHFGKHSTFDRSFCRYEEADCILKQLTSYYKQESEKCLDFSFAVITFYSGQKNIIRRKLAEKIREVEESDSTFAEFLRKVQVGTVDSYQGKEFDVMFLSLVRSAVTTNPLVKNPLLVEQQEIEKCGKSAYGFLMKENRLCVALSRQKCLLILVGDSNLYQNSHIYNGFSWGDLAQTCVPSLKALYELCEKEGSVLEYGSD